MTRFLMITIVCLQGLFAGLMAKEAAAAPELKARLEAFTQAVNQGNMDALSSFWTDDAELSRPLTGEVIEGKTEIAKFLQKRAQELKERHLQFTFKPGKVEFPEADTAVVDGVVEIGNDKGIYVRNARKVELVQQGGKWYIDSVSDIEVAPAPPNFEHLKDIEWLIGNWKDQDENVTINFANSWGKYKNFILSRYTMTVYDLDAQEGVQVIGWDPVQQKIQSWVFDTDGGFGNGIWTKNGDNWEVAMTYTLSDGKKATGTNIYTKVDNTHYKFASINRKVDGEAIPNIEAVTVIREE